MNEKKKRIKRIYKKGLMNFEERQAYNKEHQEELFQKRRKQNKKLKPPFDK